jgi:hypothetical protein
MVLEDHRLSDRLVILTILKRTRRNAQSRKASVVIRFVVEE